MPPPSHPVNKRHDAPDSRHHAVKNAPHPVQGGEEDQPWGGTDAGCGCAPLRRERAFSRSQSAFLAVPFEPQPSDCKETKSNRFFVSQSAFSPLLSAPSTAFRRYRDRCNRTFRPQISPVPLIPWGQSVRSCPAVAPLWTGEIF